MKILIPAILAVYVAAMLHTVILQEPETEPATRQHTGIIQSFSGDVVTVETDDGEIWTFYGHGYKPGQRVRVTFATLGTSDIYDDIVDDVNTLPDARN